MICNQLIRFDRCNSKPDHLPPPQASSWGTFLKGQIPQLLRTKKVRNQEPQGAKTPPLGQLFSKIQQKSTEMLRTCLEILKQWTYNMDIQNISNHSPQEIHKQVTEYDFDKY